MELQPARCRLRRVHTAASPELGSGALTGGYSPTDPVDSSELYNPSPTDEIFADGFDQETR